MNEDFAYLIEKLGPPAQAEPCDAATLRQFQGRMPSGLLELWQQYGFGTWANSKFQLSRPQDYADLVRSILQGDEEFKPAETHLVGYGGFGKLLLWNETNQNLTVDLPYLQAIADKYREGWKPFEPNIAISGPLLGIAEKTRYTLFENTPNGGPIFNKCVKRYGKLAMGECFGLFPALALGGSTDIASVKRVKALEHFSLLAQLGPIRMVIPKLNGRTETIRELGAQE